MLRAVQFTLVFVTTLVSSFSIVLGQHPSRPPQFDSVEVGKDRSITFRLHAPNVEAVRLGSSDLPGLTFGQGVEMTKEDDGVWSHRALQNKPLMGASNEAT